MAIERSFEFAGLSFDKAYSRNVWINLNGHGSRFTAEVTMVTHKDKDARVGEKVTTKDEEGKDAVTTVPIAPLKTENIVLADTPENKADIDRIRAIVYGMLAREPQFKGGKAV